MGSGRGEPAINKLLGRILLSLAKEFRLVLAAIMVVGVTQSFVGMYSLTFFQRLLDGFGSAKSLADLAPALAWYVGLTVANHTLIYIEGYPTSVLEKGAYLWVRQQAMQKIARIDFLSYQNLGTGNLVQVIENGSEAARKILMNFYLQIARSVIPNIVISLVFIRYYDQTLFLIILGGYGIFYAVAYSLMIFLRSEMEKMLAHQEDFSKFSVRAFMEMVVFRINGRFKAEFERVQGISDAIVRSRAKIYLVQELFYTGFALMIFIVEAVVIVLQAQKILAGTSTVGTLVALVSFIRIVFWPISGFSFAYVNYKLDRVAFDRFAEVLALPDDPGLEQRGELRVERGEIEFRHVSYAYPSQEVLRDFSLSLPGGSSTAFVGASGGGKSTLVRLLLHLLKPQSGQVLVDGQDLAGVNLASYYRAVAYIPQEPPIFDGSIRENITFSEPVNDARLDEIVRQVELDGLVRRLPDGLATLVGERGVKLSGGEKQRLAFARILAQDPKIVILDEPTSALDSLSEHWVTHNLAGFLRGRTRVVIAHRLQTVKEADRIIVLENGAVAQEGRFEDLLAVEGPFLRLWEEQTKEGK